MSHNKDVIQSKGRKGQQGQQQDKESLQREIAFVRLSMDNVPGEATQQHQGDKDRAVGYRFCKYKVVRSGA